MRIIFNVIITFRSLSKVRSIFAYFFFIFYFFLVQEEGTWAPKGWGVGEGAGNITELDTRTPSGRINRRHTLTLQRLAIRHSTNASDESNLSNALSPAP